MAELLHNTYFWIVLASILFAVVAFRLGRKPVTEALDARAAKIKTDLNEAARLRAEAERLLSEVQRKHRDALQTAQKILDAARESVDAMHKESERKLSDTLARREKQLFERIARSEASAVQELRSQAAGIAAAAAEKILHDNLPKSGAKLVNDAIHDLSGRLN